MGSRLIHSSFRVQGALILSFVLLGVSLSGEAQLPNLSPSVNITAPISGTTLTGSTIGLIICANAADVDGNITKVEVFDGGTLLGSLATAPFDFRANLGIGSHVLQAIATDDDGASAVSPETLVTVAEPGPLWIPTAQLGASGARLEWAGGSGPFALEQKGDLAGTWCTLLPIGMARSALLPVSRPSGLFRVADFGTMAAPPFAVELSGAAERPAPVITYAAGGGTLKLAGNFLSFDITYTNLSTPAIAAYLCGPAGTAQVAGVLVKLSPFNGGTHGRLLGSTVLTPVEKAAVLSGVTYVELATPAHPDGEIRGQIKPDLAALRACVQPAFDDFQISFRLDPWLIGGTYGGGFWVSPPSLGPVSQGPTFTIEIRADGLNTGGTAAANAIWTPADPQMVMVSHDEGQTVKITVRRAGQTTVEVVCQGARRLLFITATNYLGNPLRVSLAQ